MSARRVREASSSPANLLIVHFGQLGDVILGLPAIDAVRARFPDSRITALTGTPADQIVRLSGLVDEAIGVDRHALKRAKWRALPEIVRIVRRIRRARYDVVFDLHAYYETGLLSRISGASLRVGPRRENRSLGFAYTVQAPREDLDAHLIDRYLAVTTAGGAPPRTREPRIVPTDEDRRHVSNRFAAFAEDAPLVGLNPGAGWEKRRWPADRYVELGRRLTDAGVSILVFAGPEEPGLGTDIARRIGPSADGAERLTLGQLTALMERCSLVVSNDTGPSHVSAATGTPTLVLMPGNAGPSPFAIRGEHNRLIYGETILDITVDEVYETADEMLRAGPAQVGP